MPQRVVCRKCSTVLYEGEEVISPIDIVVQYNSICPHCGRTMKFDIDRIRIILYESLMTEAISSAQT